MRRARKTDLEREDRQAEDCGYREIARAELKQQQRRCKLLAPKQVVGRGCKALGGAGVVWGHLPGLAAELG